MRAVRDLGLLGKYTGAKTFKAENGNAGGKRSQYGKDGNDLYIDVPVGATVTEHGRERTYTFNEVGEIHKVLLGGRGGLGNEYFKSSTNRSPEQSTKGKRGEKGTFTIVLSLIVDAGLVGVPNAGKSTLLNALTNTRARVGSYPFTTTEPHLGEFYGYVIADIPGLIEGASEGKGLGHKFLRHISRTKVIIHCVSLGEEDPIQAYQLIRSELGKYSPELTLKPEWIVLTKCDLVSSLRAEKVKKIISEHSSHPVSIISAETGEGVKAFSESLMKFFGGQKAKK